MVSAKGDREEPDGKNTHIALINLVQRLKEAIWKRRPILGEIMAKHGGKTLFQYSQGFLDVNPTPLLDKRKPALIKVVGEIVAKRLGKKIARNVMADLNHLPLVSSADHHGPIDHPFFVNSNIISSIPYFGNNDIGHRYLIVFSFASISANNSSFPRGIGFHGGKDGRGPLIRLPIIPDKMKMGVVHALPRYTWENIENAKKELARHEQAGEVAPERAKKVENYLDTYFGAPDVMSEPDFNSQVTKINYNLWPSFFHACHAAGDFSRKVETFHKIPDLIYVEIETITTELLRRHHLKDEKSSIHRLLFDPAPRKKVYQLFDGIPGAFSIRKGRGTHFFWAIDSKYRRVRLILKNGKLVSEDGNFKWDFTPEAIAKALEKKEIFPAMALCYIMVALYYGMKCLGGFCQVSDLTLTKEAWREFLKEIGEKEEAEALKPVQTKELGGYGMVIAYTKTAAGGITPATGVDMAFRESNTSYKRYVDISKKVTLEEAMGALLPDVYQVLYAFKDRMPELSGVMYEQILNATGLYAKLSKEIFKIQVNDFRFLKLKNLLACCPYPKSHLKRTAKAR